MSQTCNLQSEHPDNHLVDNGLRPSYQGLRVSTAAEVGLQTARSGTELIRTSLKCIKNKAVTQEMLNCCKLFGIHYGRDSWQWISHSTLSAFNSSGKKIDWVCACVCEVGQVQSSAVLKKRFYLGYQMLVYILFWYFILKGFLPSYVTSWFSLPGFVLFPPLWLSAPPWLASPVSCSPSLPSLHKAGCFTTPCTTVLDVALSPLPVLDWFAFTGLILGFDPCLIYELWVCLAFLISCTETVLPEANTSGPRFWLFLPQTATVWESTIGHAFAILGKTVFDDMFQQPCRLS